MPTTHQKAENGHGLIVSSSLRLPWLGSGAQMTIFFHFPKMYLISVLESTLSTRRRLRRMLCPSRPKRIIFYRVSLSLAYISSWLCWWWYGFIDGVPRGSSRKLSSKSLPRSRVSIVFCAIFCALLYLEACTSLVSAPRSPSSSLPWPMDEKSGLLHHGSPRYFSISGKGLGKVEETLPFIIS